MIYDTINNHRLYAGLGPDFKDAFEMLAAEGFEKNPGRYERGNGVFYLVQSYETKPLSEGFFESHRKFIDLQYIISGNERQDFAPVSALKPREAYNDEKDLCVYDGSGSTVILSPGFFMIYFPEDGHMPNLRAGSGPGKMLKVVVKIPYKGYYTV